MIQQLTAIYHLENQTAVNMTSPLNTTPIGMSLQKGDFSRWKLGGHWRLIQGISSADYQIIQILAPTLGE